MSRLCALSGVSRAGYYAWRRRQPSAHAEQDRQLLVRIHAIFRAHHGAYGAPRIQRTLADAGVAVSRRRVARLMHGADLRGRVVRIYRANPRLHRFFEQHPNRIRGRRVTAQNQIWVGDVTYLRVNERWWYLAVVLDQHSRRVLAWSLSKRRDARLTCGVVNAAVARRHPQPGLVFHSDRGIEYTATAFRDRLRALGFLQSSALTGPGDNAHIESFFHTLKTERLHGLRFTSAHQLRHVVHRYMTYYNQARTHSALGYRSPIEYESAVA